MTVLKCKMCGGDLNFEEGVTVVDCEYCGTKQTVPTIDDEKKITLFSRANRLRYACEFDKASGVYESIVADFPEEAEAYWGLVLCKYGIEYVDDPATRKKIPTCHRSSFENVMEDENFEQVLENADPIARSVYREEAKQIEELRRSIIEVSNKEEPYDIFICYKETAENGERTIDSVIAQDVYHELTEKGYRVFFSRITLEDKLGQEYEPYIFAALNSAKIMLAFGTDYEYYNAVWVKNEWSRFLQLIAKGEKKTLIPCYKNIDAYDMPKEFARLQAQDMGKVGAMQDLLRGIEKLLPKSKETSAHSDKEPVIVQQTMQSATVDSLLKRVFMYLEDGDWSNAVEYCNRVLDISPENAEAYVGLLMAELRVSKEEELARQNKSFGQNKHFIKGLRFSTEERRKVLEGYNKAAEEQQEKERLWQKEHLEKQQRIAEEERRRQEEERRRQEEERRRQEEERRRQEEEKKKWEMKSSIYQEAVRKMNSAGTISGFRSAAVQFESISGFQDADALAVQCLEKAENVRKDGIYNSAKAALTIEGYALENIDIYEEAIKKWESIPGWRDADKWVDIFKQKIEVTRYLSNVCQYCGGELKGLLSKKCSICGKLPGKLDHYFDYVLNSCEVVTTSQEHQRQQALEETSEKKLDTLKDAKKRIERQRDMLDEGLSQYQEMFKAVGFFDRSRKKEYATEIEKLNLQRSDLISELDKISSDISRTEGEIALRAKFPQKNIT